MTLEVTQNTLKHGPLERFKSWVFKLGILFHLVVSLPTLIAIIYYGLVASDIYISESHFVVHSPERQAPAGIGALLQGVGFSKSADDTYTVHDYMRSRDAMNVISTQIPLETAFRKNVDIFSRFNRFGFSGSKEELHYYYLTKIVQLDLDTASSITTLRVHAFNADDALKINQNLLQIGEQLINKLNQRGRDDLLLRAETQVKMAEQRSRDIAAKLSAYRNSSRIIDPEAQANLQIQEVSRLRGELLSARTQLAQLQMISPENPQIPAVQKLVSMLQTDVNALDAKITGGDNSIASKVELYQRLVLEGAFADKQLASALASLDQARTDVERKQLYLERIVQPNKPDKAVEPKRTKNIISTFLVALILWGLLSVLIAGIKEHRD